MKTLRPLPLGSQTFSYIVENNAVYVDKTPYLHTLISSTVNKFFLSRPRRFGKSLTISTLDALFSGKKELFEGLYIRDKTAYDFAEFPVLRFDFSKFENKSAAALELSLSRHIKACCDDHNVSFDPTLTIRDLWELLIRSFKRNGQQVVILIDEYDKPILDHITNIPIAKENRDVLKGFYETIKANDETLRFVFITGITKFSQMNIFSGLNNLTDISLNPEYAAICGYTQQELEACFFDHISAFSQSEGLRVSELLAKIQKWYNGFRFTKRELTVYNPFSTLMLLEQQSFQYHWFATGTPTYLMQLLKQLNVDVENLPKKLSINDTASYNVDSLQVNLPALLFQTGYMTVVGLSQSQETLLLDYPNMEVKEAFTQQLMVMMARPHVSPAVTVDELREALYGNNLADVFAILTLFFAKIPYDIQESTEKYYQSLFYLIFTVIGTRIRAEVRTNTGRVDALVETDSDLYLFEFKINGSAEDALAQIEEKDYAFSFQDSGKPVHKVGVGFSVAERNIVGWVLG